MSPFQWTFLEDASLRTGQTSSTLGGTPLKWKNPSNATLDPSRFESAITATTLGISLPNAHALGKCEDASVDVGCDECEEGRLPEGKFERSKKGRGGAHEGNE